MPDAQRTEDQGIAVGVERQIFEKAGVRQAENVDESPHGVGSDPPATTGQGKSMMKLGDPSGSRSGVDTAGGAVGAVQPWSISLRIWTSESRSAAGR